ncbi:major facilitator superfamily domain-containing protein 2B isoform X3 [Dunckerocampus dactyliophorus]|uniref:major facilitator superfamily domain-containing protein 2B isoform X3 n=1 Tax=Dunckerocampus dactyliophorus TaxID=161453 RepID=UPI0024056285|nr:major facilitator superfamily domain-containing protein 2B isoform X3 [Dunckerocampus dactyliophorus]
MAAEKRKVAREEEEEEEEEEEGLPARASAHARSQSHVRFPPPMRTSGGREGGGGGQRQAPRLLAHTRSRSHTHFNTHSLKYTCRLTHSLSTMAQGESGVQGGAGGKLIKPVDPLFTGTKAPQTDLSPKLSVCSKLCFAIGGVPKEVAASATAFFLQIYLLDVAQINAFQASMVLFIGRAWGAVTDPVVGFFITKTKWTKIGRLMPWMLGCTPFLVVSYFYLWYVPPFASGRFVWYLGFYCLYQTLITKEVYMIAAGVIGSIFLVCTIVMFLGVKEKDDPYAPKTEKPIPFHQGFIMVMRHGPYLILTAAFLFILVAIQLVQNNFVLFCTYAADLREHFQNIVLTILLTRAARVLVVHQVSAVISIPLWQWFLQRFGKKTAAFCGITWIMPFTMMLVFIPNVAVAYVVAVSSGLSVAASLLLPWSMLPDVVDDFRLANPYCKGHEAIFYSFYVFYTKFAAAISLGVSTLCLEFAGYDTGACKQPAAVVYTLKLLIGAAPVAFIITGLMILLLYPITEKVRLRNKLHLEDLRKQSSSSREDLGLM